MPRSEIFGLKFDNYSLEETIEEIGNIIQKNNTPTQHVVINAAKIVHSFKDNILKTIINNCDMINVDGQAVVWAANFLGIPCKERVARIDLMNKIMEVATEKNWSIYFLGAKENILSKAINNIKRMYPNLSISGSRNGYFSDEE